jgi:hypothetical protein
MNVTMNRVIIPNAITIINIVGTSGNILHHVVNTGVFPTNLSKFVLNVSEQYAYKMVHRV